MGIGLQGTASDHLANDIIASFAINGSSDEGLVACAATRSLFFFPLRDGSLIYHIAMQLQITMKVLTLLTEQEPVP
jgi:hypothetical protein